MYVPGKLRDTEKVLVDVGTGFYIEKVVALHGRLAVRCWDLFHAQSVADAQDYFQRRMDFITRNLDELQKKLQEKHMIRESQLITSCACVTCTNAIFYGSESVS